MPHLKLITILITFLPVFFELNGQSFTVIRDTTGSEILKADFYFGFAYRDEFGNSLAKQIKQDTTVLQIDKNGQIIKYIAAYKTTSEFNQLLYVRPNDIIYFKINENSLVLNVSVESEKQVLQSLDGIIRLQEKRLPQAYQISNMDSLLDSLGTNLIQQRILVNKLCKQHNCTSFYTELLNEYINVYFLKIAFTNFNICSPVKDFSDINTKVVLKERLNNYKNMLLINAKNFVAIENFSTASINYLRFLNHDNLNEQDEFSKVLETATNEFEEPYLEFILMKLLISMAGGTSVNDTTFEKYVDLCRNKEYRNMARQIRSELLKKQEYSTTDEVRFIALETGKTLTLNELTDQSSKKLFYLDFWASWCAACKIEHKNMGHAISENQEVEFISVNIDDTLTKGQKAASSWGISTNNSFYIDPNSTFAQAFAKPSIPRFVVLNHDLKVINSNAPRPSDPKLKELLDKLLKEQ